MKTIKEIQTKINATIGKQKKLQLPYPDKSEIDPKKIKAVLKIGNLVKIETGVGPAICKVSDLDFHLDLYADNNRSIYGFHTFYGKHPHNWNDAVFMLESELNRMRSKSDYDNWKKDVAGTDLMENEEVKTRLQRTIQRTSQRLK